MTMINTRENPVVEAFVNLHSQDRHARSLAVLEARFDALYAKDPELAEAKVWQAADAVGLSSEEVHSFLAEYRYN
ncbi:hypothetical protein [Acidihalobacter ferrooxydans]|uniref:Uncharacterized protein n=1 Tax=Acidihalobacter ferrooxydans TaxID=1765967 RepID=A0A1P8UFD8_9GAMM|nr:hypothetical protein [Acidihalobacter ferrooxydans]APZ42509.1 hypothetical protein BW247_04900 [Acidihalobacter ferrooxydans]